MKHILLLTILTLPIAAQAQTPTLLTGQGSLPLTTTSSDFSSIMPSGLSPAWRQASGIIVVTNRSSSPGVAYFCPLGGPCTNAGIEIPPGLSKSINLGSGVRPMPSAIAASTATIEVAW